MYNFYLFILNYFFYFLLTILPCVVCRAVDSTSEKRLITMLVENYRQNGVDGRPVVNTSTALAVTISFSLIQILQFDPAHQVITLVGWISLVRVSSSLFLSYMYSCQLRTIA